MVFQQTVIGTGAVQGAAMVIVAESSSEGHIRDKQGHGEAAGVKRVVPEQLSPEPLTVQASNRLSLHPGEKRK